MNHVKIYRLRTEHRWLEARIREELRSPGPDAFRLQALKRRKLQVKDELFLAEAGLSPAYA